MHKAEKRRQLLTAINLILTAMILLGVIVVAGWLLMLDRQINELHTETGNLAVQLTMQSTLVAYQDEIAENSNQDETQGPAEKAEEPSPEATISSTRTPKPEQSELKKTFFQQIVLVPSPMLDELSAARYFRLPPLEFQFPEGWSYRFDTDGKLTLTDSFNNETTMTILANNEWGEFVLNEIGVFSLLADGSLSWFPDTTPRQGLGAGEYQLTINIQDYTSEPMVIQVEEAPMARILEAVSMYRTYDDILEGRRYLSFSSKQEPMSMYGYMITADGTLYIRVWRAHDKFYYWVKGDFVMHPDRGLRYNDLEDLIDDEGNEIIPQIDIAGN